MEGFLWRQKHNTHCCNLYIEHRASNIPLFAASCKGLSMAWVLLSTERDDTHAHETQSSFLKQGKLWTASMQTTYCSYRGWGLLASRTCPSTSHLHSGEENQGCSREKQAWSPSLDNIWLRWSTSNLRVNHPALHLALHYLSGHLQAVVTPDIALLPRPR